MNIKSMLNIASACLLNIAMVGQVSATPIPEILDCSDPESQPQIDDDFDSYNIGQNLNTQSPFWEYACEIFTPLDDNTVVCDHGGTETGDNIIGHAACSDGITNGAGCSTYTAESYSFLKVCVELDVVEVTNEYSALLIVDAAAGGDINDDGYYLDLRLPGRLSLRTKPTDAFLAVNDSVNFGEGDVVCLTFWDNAGTPTLTGTLNGAVAVEATDGLVHSGPFNATVFISRDQSDLTLVNGFDDFGVAECGTNVDTDGDGLVDANEDINGNGVVDAGETDPLNADSDGDGLLDGNEDINGNRVVDAGETDPLNADSDSDGLLDGNEDINGNGVVDLGESDPLDSDSDGDGLSDGYEVNIIASDPTSLTTVYVTCPSAGDMNGDGDINVGDLLLLQRQILGY